MLPRVYLAGAMRDDHAEDRAWRTEFARALVGGAIVFNPYDGKTLIPDRGWHYFGRPITGRMLIEHDFSRVDSAEIIVFNFLALADRYPCIGTLTEFGRSTARTVLRYAITPASYVGHVTAAIPTLHPFIAEHSAGMFHRTEDCRLFVVQQCALLAGQGYGETKHNG